MRVRVLHIQETIGSGGVERIRLSLAKHINKELFDLKIICTVESGNIAGEIRNNGIEVIAIGKLKGPFDWKQHQKVLKIVQDFKPHIIHGAVFEGVTMASINGFLKSVPIIIIEETSDPQNRSWRGHLLMRLFSLLSDKVIGVSPASVSYLRDKLNLPGHKIQLINNGVAIPKPVSLEEVSKIKNTYGIKAGDIIIGSVGRMLVDSTKRFSDLIRAFALISKKYKYLKLMLIGDGVELINYKKLAVELDIEGKVIFTGYQIDMAKFYNCMDIFSLVSAHESFGLVLAEAMLHSLPIVATNVGGMKYIVDNNETGFLVKKYDKSEIASKLEQLVLSKDLRNTFGEKGYRKAMTEYTDERYVAEITNFYKNLLKAKNII